MHPVCCHSVRGNYGTQGDRVLVSPFVAHDSDAAHRKEYGPGLPDGVIQGCSSHRRVGCRPDLGGSRACKCFYRCPVAFQPVFPESADENIVGFTEYMEFFFCYIPQDPDAERRSGERMPSDQFVLDAQSTAYAAYLILEQRAQRLHDLQVHLFRKSAHIVVRLDGG